MKVLQVWARVRSKEAVDFYELEFNMKGFSSLKESLNDYLSEEQL